MLFTTPMQYAIRGLTQLTLLGGPQSLMLEQLTEQTDLPRDFLAKIFGQLAKGGLLNSTRGRGGGFALARPAHLITLLDIMEALEGPSACDRCVVGLQNCDDHAACPQHDLFKPIRQRLKDYLRTTTLADLAASMKSKALAGKAEIRMSKSDRGGQ
jgi:Rrf2 family iron-sulfur cluster assembly transcriptional regulator